MNRKILSRVLRGSDAGIVNFLLLVAATTILTAGAGLLAALAHLGAGDATQEAVSKYRKAVEIAENPNLYQDADLNGATKDFQQALAEAVQKVPGSNTSLGPFVKFIPVQGRATKTTANKSETFPLTAFNRTNNTGKECGAKPVTINVTVDGMSLGTIGPGKSKSTSVSKGTHTVVGCFTGSGCASLALPVPKYTFVYFFWVCRQGVNPLDPQPGFEFGVWDAPALDPGLMETVFMDLPVIE